MPTPLAHPVLISDPGAVILMAIDYQPAAFQSQGATLRGRLYRAKESDDHPAVVMSHGFTATIPMVMDRYAEALCDAGFTVLAYDHRNFGSSDGEPRQQANPWLQAAGYRDAMDYLEASSLGPSGPIALWGDSLSADAALVVAAADDRVSAVVGQAPAFGESGVPDDPDGAIFLKIKRRLLDGDVLAAPEDAVGPLPVVSADPQSPSFLPQIQAYRWFVDFGGRFGSGWQNQATFAVPAEAPPFHAGLAAPQVACPVLLIVAPDDEINEANPAVTRQVYDSLVAPKEWVDTDGGHFGLLYPESRLFKEAVAAQTDFLHRKLQRSP
ncbi:alpha/beta hydrolase [Nocardiopsis oceani]